MTAFASIDDLVASWRPLTEQEITVATGRLLEASDLIRDLHPDIEAAVASGAVRESSLKSIVCAMVRRSMDSPVAGLDGVRQFQQSTGPFSQNFTFSNPEGNLYLTKVEKQRLGIGGQRAFTVDMTTGGEP